MAFFLETLSPEFIAESRERDRASIAEMPEDHRAETLRQRSNLIWSIFKEAEL